MLINIIDKARAAVADLNNIHVPVGDNQDKTSLGLDSVSNTIQSIIQVALNAIGLLAAFYFLYGAFMYIISYGNDSKAGKAKQTMTWAIIGLAITILARLIVSVVVQEFYNNPADTNGSQLMNQIK